MNREELLDMAWVLIANAWEGDWDKAPADWSLAAETWRDLYGGPSILSASEALYAFAGWLTTRGTPVTLSGHHDAGVAANLVHKFCQSQELEEPRDGWDSLIQPYPEEEK